MTKVEEKQRLDALHSQMETLEATVEDQKARRDNLNKRTKELLDWIMSQTEGNA